MLMLILILIVLMILILRLGLSLRINGRWACRDCGAHATTRADCLQLAGRACRGSVRPQAAAAGRNRTLAGEERVEHTLRERSGITYCVRCGAWSNGKKSQNLKKVVCGTDEAVPPGPRSAAKVVPPCHGEAAARLVPGVGATHFRKAVSGIDTI